MVSKDFKIFEILARSSGTAGGQAHSGPYAYAKTRLLPTFLKIL